MAILTHKLNRAQYEARKQALAQLKVIPPQNTVPQLVARVDLLERVLGIR